MAFNFNGNTPKKILYNGLNVAKLIYNGVVVWMSKVLATVSGILPLTLTNCTGDDLVGYKIYGNTEEVLPRGYTQVEYLESNGTQYINTRYYPNNLTDVECKFMYNQLTGNTASSVFGVRESNSGVSQFLMSVANGELWIVNGSYNHSIPSIRPLVNTEYILRITPQKAYWNGTEILTMSSSAANCKNLSMFAFGRNTWSGLANKFYGKIYYLKIYEDGVLVRNLIPCINQSNVAGMYDTVNGVFYTNAGTGTFNTGSVVSKKSVGDLVTDASDINYGKYKISVLTNSTATNIYLNKPLRKTSKLPTGYTELEHIRGTGTQYIDTNFIPNQDTRIKVKIMTKDISGMANKTVFGSRVSATSKHFGLTMGSGSQNLWWTGYGTDLIATNSSASRDTLYEIEKNKNVTILNGSILATSQSQTFTCPSNLYLFCMNQSGPTFYSNIELYLCEIWDNDVLVRDFIPCKNQSNVVGMYDTVNDVFYTNAGTGSFVAGAEVETVYYTDYLDYENQKVVRNVDDNDKGIDTPVEESVVLPAVPTDEGTTVFDVDTDVTPSYAEVKYYTKPIIENKTLKTSDNLVFITSDNKIFKLKEEE